ncbi:MAG TPA: hypothetical protein IAB87_08025 [Candidatus Coprenecus merdipullorum]|nr:hypothetical protein [Candidatus Coprenecus merdipullorum]
MIRDVSQRRTFRRDEKITMARLLFARELMMEYGVPYRCIWTFAGFSSRRQMEKAWNALF